MMTWLKKKARAWCAPDYEQLVAREFELLQDRVELSRQVDIGSKEVVDLRAHNVLATREMSDHCAKLHAELASLRKPFQTIPWDEQAPAWTEQDEAGWLALLKSETGRKVLRAAAYFEQQSNRSAIKFVTKAGGSFANNAGYACGWSDCTEYFFRTLSADVRPRQDTATQAGDGAAALRERMAP